MLDGLCSSFTNLTHQTKAAASMIWAFCQRLRQQSIQYKYLVLCCYIMRRYWQHYVVSLSIDNYQSMKLNSRTLVQMLSATHWLQTVPFYVVYVCFSSVVFLYWSPPPKLPTSPLIIDESTRHRPRKLNSVKPFLVMRSMATVAKYYQIWSLSNHKCP